MVLTRRKYASIRRKRVTRKRIGKMLGGSSAPTLKQVRLAALLMTINKLINNKNLNITDTKLEEQFTEARDYLGEGIVSTMLPVNTDTHEERNNKLNFLKSLVEKAIKSPATSANNKGNNTRKSSNTDRIKRLKDQNNSELAERRKEQNRELLYISPNTNNEPRRSSSRKSSRRASSFRFASGSLGNLSKRKQSDVTKIISELIDGINPDTVDELKNNAANPYLPVTRQLTTFDEVKTSRGQQKLAASLPARKAILIKYLTNAILTPDEKAELYLTTAEKKYIKSLITDSNLEPGYKHVKTSIIDNLGTAPMTRGLPMPKMVSKWH